MSQNSIGLYYHIPFCARLCSYCDFVKTARFDLELQTAYLHALTRRTDDWLQLLPAATPIGSVFFGGGTPSLLDRAYAPLFAAFRPRLQADAEITLEANPEHVTAEKLAIWAELGVNRLSLGVQSFQEPGLRFLTREHSSAAAEAAIAAALLVIPNLNIDLIYGWPGQTEALWLADIERALRLGVRHLSLYSLTYEGRTPLARRLQRGLLTEAPDEALAAYYRLACERLAAAGMHHEEVSNWAVPGAESRYNARYWYGQSYVGLGAGAHSFLAEEGPWGRRWRQDASWQKFAAAPFESKSADLAALLSAPEYELEADRDAESWVLETLGTGLRAAAGINLDALCRKTGYILNPRPTVSRALAEGQLRLAPDGMLTLVESEWFRETRWALEVSLSLLPDSFYN